MLPALALLLLQAEASQPVHEAAPRLRPSAEGLLAPPSALAALEEELTALHRRLRPALVRVRISLAAAGAEPRQLLVSGVVLDEGDLVVAPGPMPGDLGGIRVVRADGAEFAALQVASDESYGLSLLQAPNLGVAPPALGRCDLLPIGAVTIALGNPFDYDASMSIGFLTGRDRRIGQVQGLLQVTNPVNPGDGGGLLSDRHGQVIGILMASLAEAALRRQGAEAEEVYLRSQGISFAVPIERVVAAFQGHLTRRLASPPLLGVIVQEEYDRRTGAGMGREGAILLLVEEVDPDLPAGRAGLRPGDRILRAGDRPILSLSCLRHAVASCSGSVLELEVLREGATRTLRVELSAADPGPR